MKSDITYLQARDLARYLLGPQSTAVATPGMCALFIRGELRGVGPSWRAAFRSAGAGWPARPQFVARGKTVMRGKDAVAECRSTNFAARTANALNEYEPNPNGT